MSSPLITTAGSMLGHRGAHAARLVEYERTLLAVREKVPYPAFALEFGSGHEQAVLAWIDGLPWMRAS